MIKDKKLLNSKFKELKIKEKNKIISIVKLIYEIKLGSLGSGKKTLDKLCKYNDLNVSNKNINSIEKNINKEEEIDFITKNIKEILEELDEINYFFKKEEDLLLKEYLINVIIDRLFEKINKILIDSLKINIKIIEGEIIF